MQRLLVIEDEKLYQRMIERALQPLDLDVVYADNGEEGLQAAYANPPDMIICDVLMPTISGYEVTRRLRRDPRFVNVPILILTAQVELSNKLEAFEAGADDHMTKPFEPAELVARVTVLLRRSESLKNAVQQTSALAVREFKNQVIAVHSLRGGTGCSSLAVNLAIALQKLWSVNTLVLDMVLTAGQVALMLDASLKRTWSDISHIQPDELDNEALDSIIGRHDSGINFITSPTYPSEAELLTPELFERAFALLRTRFEYIVVDLPHDFNAMTLSVLDEADVIVEVLAPELASVRAAVAALDTYNRLGYPADKVKFVLNHTFEGRWLPRKKIEAALRRTVELVLPYTPDLFVDAINIGQPVMYGRPNEPVCETITYFAGQVSKAEHSESAPPSVQSTWQQVARRLIGS
jgi:pilus assembly protein CpaE